MRLMIALMTSTILLVSGCEDKAPDRDQIPALKKALYELQLAVTSGEHVRIDSLLASGISDHHQDSDSLLSFVSEETTGFEFVQFGKAEIFYTETLARVDCYVMGASDDQELPVMLTFELDNQLWRLKHFATGHPTITPVETE